MAVKAYTGAHAKRDFVRGLQTKNIVKGAAGGIRGVDYQDRQAEYLERRDGAAAVNLRAGDKETEQANELMRQAVNGQAQSTETKSSSKTSQALAKDGMDARQAVNVTSSEAKQEKINPKTLAKDEKIKRKLLLADDEDEQEENDEEEELDQEEDIEWVGPFADPDVDKILRKSSNAQILRLIQDPEVEMRIYGTLRLLDPQDMRKALSTPLRVARHLRVVADRMLDAGEFERDEVVHYLAGSLINLGKDFGGPALRAFANSVGISSIYPLEVIQQVAEIAPSYLPKLTLAPFITGRKTRTVKAGKTFELRCDPDLRITGLALEGGGMPGYQFAPRADPGLFAFNILSPGRFCFLLQGLDKYGFERIQRYFINVKDPQTGLVPEAETKAEAAAKEKAPKTKKQKSGQADKADKKKEKKRKKPRPEKSQLKKKSAKAKKVETSMASALPKPKPGVHNG